MATSLTIQNLTGKFELPRASATNATSCLLAVCRRLLFVQLLLTVAATSNAQEARLTLQALVTPSTVVLKDRHPVTFAIHAFVEFKSLAEAFPYIESQTQRWKGDVRLDAAARQRLGRTLVREAIESRVISM